MSTPEIADQSVASKLIEVLGEKLDLSDTAFASAVQRYKGIGSWLTREESAVREFDPKVYPQGSMALGTVVRPLSGTGAYDIDLVCELQGITTADTTQERLRSAVQSELALYISNRLKSAEMNVGKRCLTIEYDDEVSFHMDVLPCVKPDASDVRLPRVAAGVRETVVALTDSTHHSFGQSCSDWHLTNPKAFALWFEGRVKLQELVEGKSVRASVEPVKQFKRKGVLQRVVQLLKRHRDKFFSDCPAEDCEWQHRPASIVLTTICGTIYGGQQSIEDSLTSILSAFDTVIQRHGGRYVLENPTNPSENFLDRWAADPIHVRAFAEWVAAARKDFDIGVLNESKKLTSILDGLANRSSGSPSTGLVTTLRGLGAIDYLPPRSQMSWVELPPWPRRFGSARVTLEGRFRRKASGSIWRSLPPNGGKRIPKGCDLEFEATVQGLRDHYDLQWQVANTGEEARLKDDLRGDFYSCDRPRVKCESTSYAGLHWLQCFVIQNGCCVAQSGFFVVRVV